MRVRVRFIRHPMRCPTRVRNTDVALQRAFIERILQRLDFAGTSQAIDVIAITNRNTGRVVATIFEAAKAVHQYRNDVSFGNRTDDSTHLKSTPGSECHRTS